MSCCLLYTEVAKDVNYPRKRNEFFKKRFLFLLQKNEKRSILNISFAAVDCESTMNAPSYVGFPCRNILLILDFKHKHIAVLFMFYFSVL